MGIVNVTPDSFSDGGRYAEPAAALAHAKQLLADGADLLDLGAESTRPGSAPVAAEEQWRRLKPVIEGLRRETPEACLSVDTSSAEVASHALELGSEIVNDVTGLGDPAMARLVAKRGAGVVIMHMQGTPATMQKDPRYADVVAEVGAFLTERRQYAREAGIADECLAVDPGVGFGKALEHSLGVLANLDRLETGGRPLVVGVSRKSFIGRVLDRPVDRRLEGGLAATGAIVLLGARVIRTHDVATTLPAVRMADALRAARR